MGWQCTLLLLLAATCSGLGLDKMQIVATSGDHVLVKEGGEVNISCTSDQEWFFCLWRHPSGIKECTIQENGTYQSACAGMDHLEIHGSDKFCSLKVENVGAQDHGSFMCLLNQADIFHTDRRFVKLEVATPAQIVLKKKQSENNEVLELVEGEIVQLECEGRRAFPAANFKWKVPGLHKFLANEVQQQEYGSHTFHSRSLINYTAEVSHSGSIIKCTTTQTHNGAILYSDSRNLTLLITQAAPLLATKTSNFGIWTGALLALVLVILIVVIIIIIVFKKKKKVGSSDENINRSQKKDQMNIWTTKTCSPESSSIGSKLSSPLSSSNIPKIEESYTFRADVHNSSSSSSSTSSSRAPVSSDTSFETNRSVPEIVQGDFVSFSPVYMYSKKAELPPNPEDNPYKCYQPKRLGQFDPSTDVHMITRPNTAGSFQNVRLKPNPSALDISPVPYNIPVRPFRPLKIHPQDLDTLNPEDAEARLQSWDAASVGGASVISVFDCHHGCFSPDHSMPHCDEHQDGHFSSEQNKRLDQHSDQSQRQEQCYHDKSDRILVPMGEPPQGQTSENIQTVNSFHDNLYLEQSHCSPTGQRYTVKTRDTHF